MGNCQAIDVASLVIQHPSGREERLYWPVTAKEVMRSNPGHYVALIINLVMTEEENKHHHHHHHQQQQQQQEQKDNNDNNGIRITRVKLLKATDTLNLGQAYRLIDSQEVMKGLWAKKFAKMKKREKSESNEQSSQRLMIQNQEFGSQTEETNSNPGQINQATKSERHRQRTTSSSLTRSRHWRPSLQSISEATS